MVETTDISLQRVVIGGLKGDGGKSLVAIALSARLRAMGLKVAPFKVGPDYIDAAWLGASAKRPGRNLDTFMMSRDAILSSLAAGVGCDAAVIEGKRGLFDGLGEDGAHSTAELAKLIGAPVVLVIDVSKTTRTAAALVRGCQVLDPDLFIGGVILNRCASLKHEDLIRRTIEKECRIPVLGAIPKLEGETAIPMRHLGLICVEERANADETIDAMGEIGRRHLDVDAILSIAKTARPLNTRTPERPREKPPSTKTVGIFRGPAFSFYYPENLSALEALGASLVDIDPMRTDAVPDAIDGLLAGGGFPELYAEALSRNAPFMVSLRRKIVEGMPVYAECGGFMYLSGSLKCEGRVYEMASVLDAEVVQTKKPMGHGYVEALTDTANPFYDLGTLLRGHEFHYSTAEGMSDDIRTAWSLARGSGIGNKRDGVVKHKVFASYTHVHALGTPAWAPSFFNLL